LYKRFAACLFVLATMLLFPPACAKAQTPSRPDYSATMVTESGSPPKITETKVYSGKGRTRSEAVGRHGPSITIIDPARGTMWMLDPSKKTAIDMSAMIEAGKEMKKEQKTDDPSNPWAGIAQSCTSKDMGAEIVSGRNTEKWMFTFEISGKTYTNYDWIDKELSAPIRSQGEGRTMEMRDIKEGAQPDSLFEIPADYTKTTIGEMANQPHH
jgi:hypothetical protein